MTTIWPYEVKCAVCGLEQQIRALGSTNELGPRDLDMRPGEMRRSTMGYWVHECVGCGYVATDLVNAAETDRDMVRSPPYGAQLKSNSRPHLANIFVCRSILDEVAGDLVGAGRYRLYAAWVCDDTGLEEEARSQRLATLDLFERARVAGKSLTEDTVGGDEVLLTDLARRCGDFERAHSYCEKGLSLGVKPFVHRILEMQRQLCARSDSACHSVRELE